MIYKDNFYLNILVERPISIISTSLLLLPMIFIPFEILTLFLVLVCFLFLFLIMFTEDTNLQSNFIIFIGSTVLIITSSYNYYNFTEVYEVTSEKSDQNYVYSINKDDPGQTYLINIVNGREIGIRCNTNNSDFLEKDTIDIKIIKMNLQYSQTISEKCIIKGIIK